MFNFSGFGRFAAASVLASVIGAATLAYADDVTPEQVKAARAAISTLGVTNEFDNILPSIAEKIKSEIIQASPNYTDVISSTVDEKALALAPRRADLEQEAATIYAKAFTLEELNAITQFYSSPAGKKLIAAGPIATRELYKAADIWAAGVSRDLSKESEDTLAKVIGADLKANPPATDGTAEQPAQ